MQNNIYKALSANWRMGFCFFTLVSFFIFYSCSNEIKKEDTIVKKNVPQDLDKEIKNLLSDFITNDSIIIIDSVPLSCYSYFKLLYNQKLVWFNQSALSPKGDSLLKLIRNSLLNLFQGFLHTSSQLCSRIMHQ